MSSPLPNISSKITTADNEALTDSESLTQTGALFYTNQKSTDDAGHQVVAGSGYFALNFDGSKSNAIYGKSKTNQPPASQFLIIIKF